MLLIWMKQLIQERKKRLSPKECFYMYAIGHSILLYGSERPLIAQKQTHNSISMSSSYVRHCRYCNNRANDRRIRRNGEKNKKTLNSNSRWAITALNVPYQICWIGKSVVTLANMLVIFFSGLCSKFSESRSDKLVYRFNDRRQATIRF